jgi:uncharacterized protein YjbI with pentapeptide repeats
MANDDHIDWLKKGVAAWNWWREKSSVIQADLSGADLSTADLAEANLRGADLSHANLSHANLTDAFLTDASLTDANLRAANLTDAKLSMADLRRANLSEANLRGANLSEANLFSTDLIWADLRGAHLFRTDLRDSNLTEADLRGANLRMADLSGANLSGANLNGVDMEYAGLVDTDLTDADLTGCRIYGISAWSLNLEGAKQQNLIITHRNEPTVTVDNNEVAQFIYLLLHNEKIRDVIDTVGRKGVLLLGRFTEGRMVVLERLREKLRNLGYVPIVFNFDKPGTKNFTETVGWLANLSHFVIVDISNPRSTPLELQATVPDYMVPFVPILEQGQEPFAMFVDLQNKYDWVLPGITYPSVDRLIEVLEDKIVTPAQAKFKELSMRREQKLRMDPA